MDARSIVLLVAGGSVLPALATAAAAAPAARPVPAIAVGPASIGAPVAAPLAAPLAALPPALQRRKRGAEPPARVELEPFVGELAAASTASRERNAPLLVLIALEGEEASDRFRDQLLPSPELAALARDAIVVLANNGLHDVETVEVEGADGKPLEVRRCKAYRTPSCTDHQRAWDQAYAAFYPEQDMVTPAVVVAAPDGEVLARLSNRDVPSLDNIGDKLRAAHERAGPVVSAENVRAVKALEGPTRTEAVAGRWIEAWQGWQAIAELAPGGVFAERARRGLEEARAGARELVDGLTARLVPGTAADAWEELDALARAAEGLEIERELKRTVAAAERQDDIADEIDARKAELEARAMWQEAQALVRAGDERRAERLVRKLCTHRRLRETAAAYEARAAYPGWTGDDDG